MWRTRSVSVSLLLLLLPVAGLALVLWLYRCGQGHRRQKRIGGGGGDDKGTLRVRQSVTSELTIPGNVVGRVIGRHGLRVRQLEEESGARIKFKDQQQSQDKVAVITGRAECVCAAEEGVKRIVEEMVKKGEEGSATVPVPHFAVGRIIGRQGNTIRSLQRQSGGRINMVHGSEDSLESMCVVSGTQEQIDRAVALIKESIQQSKLSRRRKSLRSNSSPSLTYTQLPETEDFFPAFVSAVDIKGGVWVQLVEGQDPANLESLVEMMTADYSLQLGQETLEVVEGMLCAVPFEHDSSWYRARVVRVEEGQAEVLYVDYGDSGTVRLCKLRTLKPEYCVLPVQAVRCELAGINPAGRGTWEEGAVRELDMLTLCATWKVVMVRRRGWRGDTPTIQVVDTTTDQDVDVAAQLVATGHAEWIDSTQSSECDQSGRVVVFHWEEDAREVGVAGSFSQWKTVALKERSAAVFECELCLPQGRHEYKFLVDGHWKHDRTQPTVANSSGALNNIIEV